jgi:hypothetical protein
MAGDIKLTAGKFIVDESGYGLVGYYGTSAATFGNGNRGINLRGNTTRPQYNSKDIAMLSDMSDRVVETYVSPTGNTWYRRWDSGFKECGTYAEPNADGYEWEFPNNGFSNTNYTIVGNCYTDGFLSAVRISHTNSTASKADMSFGAGSTYKTAQKVWLYACGY